MVTVITMLLSKASLTCSEENKLRECLENSGLFNDENRRLKKMFAELSMQNELLKEALGKK